MLNKIILGDCLEVMKEIPDESIDLVLTDPPYNISQKNKIFRDYRNGKRGDINFDFGCVDEDTLILTANGIKKYNELKVGEMIATFNLTNNELEYQPLLKLNVFNYNDKLIRVKRHNKVWLYTPNHNIVRYDYNNKKSILRKISNIKSKLFEIPIPKGLNLPDINIDDNYFKLLGWFLSEGNISEFLTNNKYYSRKIQICQNFRNKRHRKEIKNILNHLNISYIENKNGFYIRSENYKLLDNLNFKKYFIPQWLKKASIRQKRLFIDAYIKGDRSKLSSGYYIYFSKKYENFAKEMQIICLESGLLTSIRYGISGFNKEKIIMNIFSNKKKSISLFFDGQENYTGKVWCPSVKNKTWISYKNGIFCITGNSWDYNFDIEPFLIETKRILKPFGQWLIFSSEQLFGKYREWFQKNGHFKQLIIWEITNPIPQFRKCGYRQATQLILWAYKNKPSKKEQHFNFLTQKEMRNIFKYPLCGGNERTKHPTQKPLILIEQLLKIHSREGDVVLDPFLGSGTTAVACIRLKRNFIGIELSEEYYKIAEERIKNEQKLQRLF
ncbi:MAG TPA: DNA methyltransferase [Candidatus Diapherotrites archaeon]|nr:DNA methyltransferase [Candidatus Diapherotrites archaeon]